MEIKIYTKSDDVKGTPTFTLTPKSIKVAKRCWKQLMYRWEHKKVLQIPEYHAAIASGEVIAIIVVS